MNARYVIFSQRAFNAIVTETLDKNPIETGGIFLGYILDNGAWVVIENIPPGDNATHRQAYFEYDVDFVNYLSNVVAKQYQGNLQLLGLWHRHPGSMDFFSNTDDGTNLKFAQDRECGAVSALVNCDPKMRITMYAVSQHGSYTPIPWYVDDGQTIPERMLNLRFISEDDLPIVNGHGDTRSTPQQPATPITDDQQQLEVESTSNEGRESYGIRQAISDFYAIISKLIHK